MNAGDVDRAGRDAMLTGAGPGAVFGPHIRGFEKTVTSVSAIKNLSFYAYQTLKYGARVAGGELDGDGRDEMASAPGPGAMFAPQIRGFRYTGSASALAKVNFWAFPQSGYGAKVDLAPLDVDGYSEILTGRGQAASAVAEVRAFDYDAVSVSQMPGVSFLASTTHVGANVAGADVDIDGLPELIVGLGPDASAATRTHAFEVEGGSVVAVPGFDFIVFPGLMYGLEVGGGR